MTFLILILIATSIAFATGGIKISNRELTIEQDPNTKEYYYVSKPVDVFDSYQAAPEPAKHAYPQNVPQNIYQPIQQNNDDELEDEEIDNTSRAKSNADRIFDSYSEEFKWSMAQLELSARDHEIHLSDDAEHDLTNDIFLLYKSVKDLFDKLEDSGIHSEYEIDYARNISKLASILGESYYINVVKNSDQWNDSESRIQKVRETLTSMTQKTSTDIRKVNAANDFELNVILETLKDAPEKNVIENVFTKNKEMRSE